MSATSPTLPCGCKDARTGSGFGALHCFLPSQGRSGWRGECQVGHETQFCVRVLAASSSTATSSRPEPQKQELLPVAQATSTSNSKACSLGLGQARRLARTFFGNP